MGELPRVQVYWNLHKSCYSIQCSRTRLVIAHVQDLFLGSVTFKVSEAGRQRVLRERRKNVHAFIQGTILMGDAKTLNLGFYEEISYNPYLGPTFYCKRSQESIHEALGVYLAPHAKIYLLGDLSCGMK